MRSIKAPVRTALLATALTFAALGPSAEAFATALMPASAKPGDPCADPSGHPGRTGEDGNCQLPYGPPPPRQQPPR